MDGVCIFCTGVFQITRCRRRVSIHAQQQRSDYSEAGNQSINSDNRDDHNQVYNQHTRKRCDVTQLHSDLHAAKFRNLPGPPPTATLNLMGSLYCTGGQRPYALLSLQNFSDAAVTPLPDSYATPNKYTCNAARCLPEVIQNALRSIHINSQKQ